MRAVHRPPARGAILAPLLRLFRRDFGLLALFAAAALSAAACGTGASTAAPDSGITVETSTGDWLHTAQNHILRSDGTVWHGRGANLNDTRSCNACTYQAPSAAEVMRRADELIDNWKANFIRLDLESYGSATEGGSPPRVHWQGLLADAGYLADIQAIVSHISAKGAYTMVSLWVDPTFTQTSSSTSEAGWPTAATNAVLAKLAQTFLDDPHVLFGVCNEPQNNFDGSLDAAAWSAMNSAVAAIRAVEDAAGTPHHIVAVQGTGGWSSRLDYYVAHPIAASGGGNVAYEAHVYVPSSQFAQVFGNAAKTIPVIIGEFGPANMSDSDLAALQQQAEQNGIPHLAWTLHMRCDPSLLVDNSGGGCGIGMALQPSPWGQLLKTRLAIPW